MAFHLFAPMMSLLLLLPQQTPDGVLRGVVRSTEGQMPVELAVVEVLGPQHLMAWTDRQGRYEVHGVEPGVWQVLVTHAGHEPMELEVRVPPQGTVVLDVTLKVRPVRLAPLHARGDRLPEHFPHPVEPIFGVSTMRAMESSFGAAELGLTDVLYGPWGETPPDASDVLFIRGSTTDLKLVLLDGAPIYAPFHLGGLLPAFPPDVLESSTVRFGGASARYDGGLAYVLDLQTRRGSDELHTDGSLDMMSGQATAEGSLGRSVHLIASGRGVDGSPMQRLLAEPFPYHYRDGLARADVDVVGGGHLTTTAFGNSEGVDLGGGPVDRLEWGNTAFSLRYEAPMGDSLRAHLTVAYGGFAGRLPPMGDLNLETQSSAARLRLAADFERRAGALRLHYGGAFERHWLDYKAYADSVRNRRRGLLYDVALGEPVAALYVDGTWAATRQLSLHGGLRANLFGVLGSTRFAPRASLSYRITDAATMTFSAGRFYQYVRKPELQLAFSNVYDSPAPLLMFDPTNLLVVGEATHYVVGLDQELSQTMRLQLDATYRHLSPSVSGAATGTVADTARAPGIESSGVDIWLRRAGNNITGWLGYSLGWTWAAASSDGVAKAILAGRHLLSVGVAGSLPGGAYLSLRMNYGAGLPLTAVNPIARDAMLQQTESLSTADILASAGGGTAAVEPSATYLRLDAELSRTWSGGGERGFQLTPYFRVLNALDRRDALFYREDGQGLHPLGSLPLIPVLGLAWRF